MKIKDMKPKIGPLVLLTVLLSFCINACKDTSVESKKTASDIEFKTETEVIETQIKQESDKKTPTTSKLSSALRPNEKIELGKTYTDTVDYISFDDNSDYWYFLAQKNKDTVQIMYHADIPINELVKGDKIVIDWEIKILEEAGDDDITYVKPYLISFRKISAAELIDEKVKVLWRENLYDEDLETEINTLVLNDDYLKNTSDPEKAALGYISFNIGSECEWDGKVNDDRSNLKCKMLTGLGLGYQCSDKHIGFLNKWFAKDTVALKKLKACPTIPNTATKQTTFDEISIKTNTQDQTILINYKVTGLNMREGRISSYTKTDKFEYNIDNITLINSEKTVHETDTHR